MFSASRRVRLGLVAFFAAGVVAVLVTPPVHARRPTTEAEEDLPDPHGQVLEMSAIADNTDE